MCIESGPGSWAVFLLLPVMLSGWSIWLRTISPASQDFSVDSGTMEVIFLCHHSWNHSETLANIEILSASRD